MNYLIDTNIVTYILKRNVTVNNKLKEVNRLGEEVFISCLSYYEVKRGLLAINATRQLSEFNQFCREYSVLFLDDIEIIERASTIHADLKRRGRPIQDADILIAATAITRGLILVSNDSDMLRVSGITVENWMDLES
ncbi:type II toxin-antitoxin system VapC family toxin [Argonema galeatum]|uniref:type II toxin-antitoxin system VapC family toxin n=1 Tax=Argonema galeatum TaxID=2942762 RepID=UPI0020133058|nr:type II toxin-antitoxin system VapC family toxin [Argonema galeatum]MCL1463585.1 type II toxin-antitoxin system VapC family toxin [Argonema galeatum A003/A1]